MTFLTASTLLLSLVLLAPIRTNAAPLLQRNSLLNSTAPMQYLENAITARFMNQQFASLNETDVCSGNMTACIGISFAMCVSDVWVLTPCANGLACAAVPQSSKLGVVLSCDSADDISQRFAFAGVDSGLESDDGGDCDGDDDDDDDDDSSISAISTVSSPTSAPSSSAAAVTAAPGLANRRLHRRQLAGVSGSRLYFISYLTRSLRPPLHPRCLRSQSTSVHPSCEALLYLIVSSRAYQPFQPHPRRRPQSLAPRPSPLLRLS
ncbi:hypothetical protein B0H15DRAFT_780275 [Mycena belliarum]|uniref:Carbohydrate-binding module family 19 domain-containing protein n=1 Tax=Mycena belliarum TaxID=1033014 RepID=A0AAD6U3H2_9AGAR|nr:hypothetical protein B0H15DRAFT_780275 [Mycena belliae]